jgi:hypothetical protein
MHGAELPPTLDAMTLAQKQDLLHNLLTDITEVEMHVAELPPTLDAMTLAQKQDLLHNVLTDNIAMHQQHSRCAMLTANIEKQQDIMKEMILANDKRCDELQGLLRMDPAWEDEQKRRSLIACAQHKQLAEATAKAPNADWSDTQKKEKQVWLFPSGDKYHTCSCSRGGKHDPAMVPLSIAIKLRKTACQWCHDQHGVPKDGKESGWQVCGTSDG